MKRHPDIWNELNEISPAVANLSPENLFFVPEGYFARLAADLLTRIRANEAADSTEELELLSTTLSKVDKKLPLSAVPAGYFENLATEILAKVMMSTELAPDKELSMLSPLLSGIEKKTPFTVPEGYFENLQPHKKSVPSKKGKLIPMKQPNRWVNLAAAAVITGFIAISAWLMFFNNERYTIQPGNLTIDLNNELPKVSDDEMARYLESTPVNLSEELPVAGNEELDVETLLEELPEKELQDYLQENPEIKNESVTN